jgi:dihydrolipoamide dehydrogenase
MSQPSQVDVVVIGGGPGGYVAAIRCAQLGLSTVCVEREGLGGTCLNWGCIPTKALLRSAEVLELAHRAAEFGVVVVDVSFDFAKMIERSRGIAAKISKGVDYLFRKNKVTHVRGTARLAGAGRVEIAAADGSKSAIVGRAIVVATGARAKDLPGVERDGERVIAYREAMTLRARPGSMVVIGAGAIGMEFASFYRALGTEVTIVEFLDRLVPLEDEDVSAEVARAYKRRGIGVMTGHKVTSATRAGDHVRVAIEPKSGGEATTLAVDCVLVAVGIAPNTEALGCDEVGIRRDPRGFIAVNQHLETGVRGVYAIGDCISTGPALAHVASAQAVYAAERIAGHAPIAIDYEAIPACTYCHPEIASVGLTEAQARQRGIDIRVGTFPFGPLGKTLAAGEYPGFAKLIWDSSNNSLVGAHLVGPAVTDLIAEPTLAKTTEVNAESLFHTVHAHPTFAEALKEAAEHAYGRAIHL